MDYINHQAPLSLEFSKQEYWSGLPFPSPGDLPNPGIKPGSSALQEDSLTSEPSNDMHGKVKYYIPFWLLDFSFCVNKIIYFVHYFTMY